MAKEYIEREAACALMPDDYYGWRDKQILNFIPAADVAPVVRCKDCRSQRWCKFAQYLGNDGFCSQGEYATNCGARMDGDGE